MTAKALTLLTREGCGLCETFLESLALELPELLAQLQLADVDSRAGWKARFGNLIPVLLDDEGTVLCETFFDAEKIRFGISA